MAGFSMNPMLNEVRKARRVAVPPARRPGRVLPDHRRQAADPTGHTDAPGSRRPDRRPASDHGPDRSPQPPANHDHRSREGVATNGSVSSIRHNLGLAHLNLAIALLYGSHLDQAAPEARAAVAALPDRPQPSFVLGLIARGDNQIEDAAAAFRRVLEIDPDDAATKVNLGQVLLQQRKFDEAVELFRAASAAEPYNATAAYNLATALTRAGNTDAGQQAMRRFQTLRDSAYAVTYAQGLPAAGPLRRGHGVDRRRARSRRSQHARASPSSTPRRRCSPRLRLRRQAPAACSSSTSTTTATSIC